MLFEDFLFLALVTINLHTILVRFDPEGILLLQSKYRLKATKGLGKVVKTDFHYTRDVRNDLLIVL